MTRHRTHSTHLPRRKSVCLKGSFVLNVATLGGMLLLASGGAGKAQTYSLQQLTNGATFNVPTSAGNSLIFQNFANYPAIGTHTRQPGQLDPPTDQIFATAINVGTDHPGLMWQSTDWSVNPTQFFDTTWTYDVVTSDGSNAIRGAGMALGSYVAQAGGEIQITSALTSSAVNLGNLLNDPGTTQDYVTFTPTNLVNVSKDVSLDGDASGNASLNTFTQTFSVTPRVLADTPEPGAYAMFAGLGVSGSLLSFYRARRKRRS